MYIESKFNIWIVHCTKYCARIKNGRYMHIFSIFNVNMSSNLPIRWCDYHFVAILSYRIIQTQQIIISIQFKSTICHLYIYSHCVDCFLRRSFLTDCLTLHTALLESLVLDVTAKTISQHCLLNIKLKQAKA